MERTAERVREIDLRIQHLCDWFGVLPPQLTREGNRILLSMEFLDWLKEICSERTER